MNVVCYNFAWRFKGSASFVILFSLKGKTTNASVYTNQYNGAIQSFIISSVSVISMR